MRHWRRLPPAPRIPRRSSSRSVASRPYLTRRVSIRGARGSYLDTLLRATKDELPRRGHAGHGIAFDLELRERRGRERELQELALNGALDRPREVRTCGDADIARHVGSGLGQRQGDGHAGRALAGVSRPRADDVGGWSIRHRLLFLHGG